MSPPKNTATISWRRSSFDITTSPPLPPHLGGHEEGRVRVPLGPHLGVRQASEGAELPAHLVQAIAQDLGDRWARWGPFNLGGNLWEICGIYLWERDV